MISASNKWLMVGAGLLLALLISALAPVITPFLIAAILAYLTDPLVNRLQQLKIPRTLAVTIVFLFLLMGFILLFAIVIPLLEEQIVALIARIPEVIAWAGTTALPWLNQHFGTDYVFDMASAKQLISNYLPQAGKLAPLMKSMTHSGVRLLEWLINLLLIPVVMFYLLRDWHTVLAGIQALLPRRIEPVVTRLFRECDEVLSAFLRGQFLVMIALGVLYALGLWIIGIDLAFLIGVIGGLVSIVPYLGLILGFCTASIAALIQYHEPIYIFYVLIVFVIAQSIEGMVLTPLLVGGKIGLHPVAVIFSILAGGQLFGFFGILLALPVAAIIMVFIRYFRQRYIASRLYGQAPGAS